VALSADHQPDAGPENVENVLGIGGVLVYDQASGSSLSGRLPCTRPEWLMISRMEGTVRNSQTQVEDSSSGHVLFPVAVGVIFLVVLVIGALLS
jgi:hypothetical protein